MRATRHFGCVVLVAALCATAAAAGQPVIEDVLGILRERGILDEEQYSDLRTRNAAYEGERRRLSDRIELSGDFRARHESFWFDEDALGDERTNRFRLRYRLRLDGKASVNEHITLGFRIGSGDLHDSGNESLGGGDDFDPDSLNIHRAFLRGRLPLGESRALVDFGKIPNPFRWSVGKDYVWDSDINPEGVSVQFSATPDEDTRLFANAAYLMIDEEGSAKDPHVVGLQLGGQRALGDAIVLGGRGSYYAFRSVDDSFLARNAAEGNLFDGLGGGSGESIGVGELTLFARFAADSATPLLAYGTFLKNFDAESVAGAGKEDDGFGLGLELALKDYGAKLGAVYWELEANAFPARFFDSDILDSRSNREGFGIYGSKRVLPRTDLKLELFVGDEIEDDPVFVDSLGGADRVRLRTDLVVKF